jgi:hypothetical protein
MCYCDCTCNRVFYVSAKNNLGGEMEVTKDIEKGWD